MVAIGWRMRYNEGGKLWFCVGDLMPSIFNHLEFIDGYFSGTMQLDQCGCRFVFEFGYDAEFRKLKLFHCRTLLRNFSANDIEPISIAELEEEFGDIIMEEILHKFHSNYGRYQSYEEYEAEAFEEDYGY